MNLNSLFAFLYFQFFWNKQVLLCKLNNSKKLTKCIGSIEEEVVNSVCDKGANISFQISRGVNCSLLGGGVNLCRFLVCKMLNTLFLDWNFCFLIKLSQFLYLLFTIAACQEKGMKRRHSSVSSSIWEIGIMQKELCIVDCSVWLL